MNKIAEAKARLPLPELMLCLGVGDRAKKSALCPFHEDKRASFSVWQNGDGLWSWKCHAGCGHGDEINFIELHEALPRREATKRFLEMAGVNGSKRAKPIQTFDWQKCVAAFTDKHVEQLAEWRGFSPSLVRELRDNSQIGIYNHLVAFPVHNNGNVIGTHFRLKSGDWNYAPIGIKAAPLVFGQLGERVHVFESTWDGLDFLDKSGERDGVIITRGAGNAALVADLIPQGATAICWTQNDEAGSRWEKGIVANTNCAVRRVRIPAPVKDFNEWTNSGATVDDLLEAMASAETVQEPQPMVESSEGAGGNDEATLTRLAALPLLEYERVREAEAEKLKCRVAILDKLVEEKRPPSIFGDTLQGKIMELPDVEPWPLLVSGADVLDETAAAFSEYIALPECAADALALWCAHAHAFAAFQCSPRLYVTSPEKGCGKTTLRDVISFFVPRALSTENLTVAVLFRVIEEHRPTILADECDTWIRDSEELRGLLNAGHRRGGQALRCEGESNEVRAFNVFAPAVLCGIGSLPGTLHDRSIVVRLERAKPGELHARFDSRHVEHETELCRKLARFTVHNIAKLEMCDPKMPGYAFNRLADNWRPLFAVAEIAAGDWPQRAALAFTNLTEKADVDAQGIGMMLLTDIKQCCDGCDRIFSKSLIERLCLMTDRPWPEANRGGKPITETWLARKLRSFHVASRNIRIGEDQAKGYELADFAEVFDRYLPTIQGGLNASQRPKT